MAIAILGIDLAASSWAAVGSAVLTLKRADSFSGAAVQVGVLKARPGSPTVDDMISAIDEAAVTFGVRVVSIDGPQGWRDPDASTRKGCGRWAEYCARAQGKAGPYGQVYPGTQSRWFKFAIELFHELQARGRAKLINCTNVALRSAAPPGAYALIECFPTQTWRSLGLTPLPGKRRAPRGVVRDFANQLAAKLDLPGASSIDHHDHLQALLATLPGVALAATALRATSHGVPGKMVKGGPGGPPDHWVEGLIWDAMAPAAGDRSSAFDAPWEGSSGTSARAAHGGAPQAGVDSDSPGLIDERDDHGDELVERGVRLFLKLVEFARHREAAGVGYKEFVEAVHGVDFVDLAGRPWSLSDAGTYVLPLADQITREAGGRQRLSRDGRSIEVGMDSFIWQAAKGHGRADKTWDPGSPYCPPYSKEEWEHFFPDGSRKVLKSDKIATILGPNS